jgi:23S rRNA (uridine2552-2'-O)-methyltransferase
MTRQWLRERQRDYYYRLAVMEGYRSRAAYKLLQTAGKYPLVKEGDVVVDLGAAPGGWMQAALTIVGEHGFVLGIDLQPIKELKNPNAVAFVADIEKLTAEDILKRLPRRPNVILSDISPNLSGIWGVDHARQLDLARITLRLAEGLLEVGGNMLVKVFQGEFFKRYLEEVRTYFKSVRTLKPKASRKASAEMYILAIGLRDQA